MDQSEQRTGSILFLFMFWETQIKQEKQKDPLDPLSVIYASTGHPFQL